MEIDENFGLPSESNVFEEIAKSDQKISVATEPRRYGKLITTVRGFDKKVDIKGVAKHLKAKLACGGTVKDGRIELQGNHKRQVRPLLIELGFADDSISD